MNTTIAPETRVLVCEGSCNPNLSIAEAMIRDYRRGEACRRVGIVEPVYDERILGIVKRQRHTTHERTGRALRGAGRWRCTVCHHERTF